MSHVTPIITSLHASLSPGHLTHSLHSRSITMATIPFNPSDFSHLSLPTFSFPPMKDISLFLFRNSLASKMKRGIRSFCNGITSTSTLNQNNNNTDAANVSCIAAPSLSYSNNLNGSPKTLEEMLLQLDLEEAAARRSAKLDEYGELNRRMSCVNNSDILRSARNALNQYPRFSLDGKDAMYRSSFRNFECFGRKSCSSYELDVERSLRMPATVAGECVVWCKPSVVAKLMGLDVVPVPVPVRAKSRGRHGRRRSLLNNAVLASRNWTMEKERTLGMEIMRRTSVGSRSTTAAVRKSVERVEGCGDSLECRRVR